MTLELRQPGRQAALGFILATVFLDALSFGLVFPILPRLTLELAHGDNALAAQVVGLVAGAWALMNFFAAPVLGVISDRFGRRPVILISTFGYALDLMVMALAPSLGWLVFGRMLSGVTAASTSTASAYLADITPPDQRARRFGLFGGVYAAGMILGPAAGGLLGEIGPRAPFWAAAGLAALGWLYGLLVLPESLPPERRTPIAWRNANPIRSLGILVRDKGLLGLAGVATLMQLASTSANSLFVLYAGYRYGWSSGQVGLMLMAFSAGNILVMSIMTPWIVTRRGERITVLWGLGFSAAGFAAIGLAATSLQFCAGTVVVCLGSMCGPALQALETEQVDPAEQGRLQGALGGVAALTGMVGPIVFTQIYARSVAAGTPPAWSGLALLIGAALLLAALALAYAVARRTART